MIKWFELLSHHTYHQEPRIRGPLKWPSHQLSTRRKRYGIPIKIWFKEDEIRLDELANDEEISQTVAIQTGPKLQAIQVLRG